MSVENEINALIAAALEPVWEDIDTLTARIDALEAVEPAPQAPEATVFGPGIPGIESGGAGKDNIHMTTGAVGVRFTAHESSEVAWIALPFTNRSGSSYGAGNGGRYRVGIQTLLADKMPSGVWVDDRYVDADLPRIDSPASWSKRFTFTDGPVLTAGVDYAMVIAAIGASPDDDWSCYNVPYNPRSRWFPMHADESFDAASGERSRLVIGNSTYNSPYGWTDSGAKHGTYPSMDIAYVNGGHEGAAAIHGESSSALGTVSSANRCTWEWQHYDDTVTFDTVGIFASHQSGTAPLACIVKVNGASVASGTFTDSPALSSGLADADWTEATLPSAVTIEPGDDVVIEFITTAGTYLLQVMLCHESGTATDQRMLSMPFLGDGTTRHRAKQNGSYVYGAWSGYTCFMSYVRQVA